MPRITEKHLERLIQSLEMNMQDAKLLGNDETLRLETLNKYVRVAVSNGKVLFTQGYLDKKELHQRVTGYLEGLRKNNIFC